MSAEGKGVFIRGHRLVKDPERRSGRPKSKNHEDTKDAKKEESSANLANRRSRSMPSRQRVITPVRASVLTPCIRSCFAEAIGYD